MSLFGLPCTSSCSTSAWRCVSPSASPECRRSPAASARRRRVTLRPPASTVRTASSSSSRRRGLGDVAARARGERARRPWRGRASPTARRSAAADSRGAARASRSRPCAPGSARSSSTSAQSGWRASAVSASSRSTAREHVEWRRRSCGQHVRERLQDQRVIVDDEDFHGGPPGPCGGSRTRASPVTWSSRCAS